MKRTIKKMMVVLILFCVSITLYACSGNKQKAEVPLSEALSGERKIWYILSGNEIGKDSKIRDIIVSNNKKISLYALDANEITFKQIKGKSDDEIIKLAQNISYKAIDKQVSDYSKSDLTDEMKRGLKIIKETHLENLDYKLKIETDDTGNFTKNESIVLMYKSEVFQTLPFTFMDASNYINIYDSNYSGYSNSLSGSDGSVFITKTNYVMKPHEQGIFPFALDTPDNKDIEVD